MEAAIDSYEATYEASHHQKTDTPDDFLFEYCGFHCGVTIPKLLAKYDEDRLVYRLWSTHGARRVE